MSTNWTDSPWRGRQRFHTRRSQSHCRVRQLVDADGTLILVRSTRRTVLRLQWPQSQFKLPFAPMDTLLTAAITILAGVLVYSLGQFIVRGLIEPALELRRLIGKIAYDLDFYANKMDAEHEHEVRTVFRDDACSLRSKLYLLTWFKVFDLPPPDDISKASAALIGQSNFHYPPDPKHWVSSESEIKKLLRIRR